MKITRTSMIDNQQRTMDLDVTDAQMVEFASPGRRCIQDIFPNLSPPEREFILNGITPEQWAATFPPPPLSYAELRDKVLSDPATTFAVAATITGWEKRDPVDALRDVDILRNLASRRLAELTHTPEQIAAAIAAARDLYAAPSDDDLEIDDQPSVSCSEEGVFVAAWVWVPKDEYTDEDEE